MSRNIYTFVLILIMSLQIFAKQACCATIEDNGAYRFETMEDYNNFWKGSGQLISENEGKVFATDAMVGQAFSSDHVQDGETITVQFIRPDGSFRSNATITYDLSTDCWTGGSWFPSCGDPDNPRYNRFVSWLYAINIPNEMLGNWTINVLGNGVLLFSEQFELVGKELVVISGDEQKGLPGETLREPFVVRLQNSDDKEGIPGATVTFKITSQPKGTKGAGLTETGDVAAIAGESLSLAAAPPEGETLPTTLDLVTDANGSVSAYLKVGTGKKGRLQCHCYCA